jgi:hypothetical protein
MTLLSYEVYMRSITLFCSVCINCSYFSGSKVSADQGGVMLT